MKKTDSINKSNIFSRYIFNITASVISGLMILMYTLNYNANKESKELNKQAREIDIRLQLKTLDFQKDIQELKIKNKTNEDNINSINITNGQILTSQKHLLNEVKRINQKLDRGRYYMEIAK